MTEPAGFAQAVEIARHERRRHCLRMPSGGWAECECGWYGQDHVDPVTEWDRHVEESVLSALLAARMETPCPKGCDHGYVPHPEASRWPEKRIVVACPNPDCHEGMVTTERPLIVMGGEIPPASLGEAATALFDHYGRGVDGSPVRMLAPSVVARLTKEPE
jgi:hypothetical protein